MLLFYVPDITGDLISLPEEEARHCVNVFRVGRGETITLTDGKGFFYEAIIVDIPKKNVLVRIKSRFREPTDRNYRLHIAIAPTKNPGRYEWFLEKAVEIGIDEITPLITSRCERKSLRAERMEKILISAMKQSLKATLPELYPPVQLNELLKTADIKSRKFIAYCETDMGDLLKNKYAAGSDVLILIGPEGDFTSEEVNMAVTSGFIPVSFGRSRLRTETAGIVACHSIYILNQK